MILPSTEQLGQARVVRLLCGIILLSGCAVGPNYRRREAQQQLFPAELNLARTQRDQLLAVVTLYKGLGAGWQDEMNPNSHP